MNGKGLTMGTSIGSWSHQCLAAVLIAMFAMVFVIARAVLSEMPEFGKASSWIVAFCVALLSIMGLVRFFGSPETGISSEIETRGLGGLISVLVLPYVALALTLLLVLFLFEPSGMLHGSESQCRQEPTNGHRTIAKRSMQKSERRRKETKSCDLSGQRHCMVQKNGEIIKKGDR